MWGTKHTIREISQIALQTCLDMINSVSQMEDEDISSQFFESFYVRILRDILEVLVDPDCRNGRQCLTLLAHFPLYNSNMYLYRF
jgi:exportin-1